MARWLLDGNGRRGGSSMVMNGKGWRNPDWTVIATVMDGDG